MTRNVVDVTLTLDTSAYADNDVMAVPQEVTEFFPSLSGRLSSVKLQSVTILDGDDQNADFDLVFLNANGSLGTINGAVSVTDAVAATIIGYVRVVASTHSNDLIGSRLFSVSGINQILKSAGATTSVWIGAIVRSGTPTYTAAAMKIKLGFE